MIIYAALGSDIFVPHRYHKEMTMARELYPWRLFSYHYHANKKNEPSEAILGSLDDQKTDPRVKLFLDSGAFSAYSMGAEIDVHRYGEFILQTQERFTWDVVANLDIIGGTEQQNWDNLDILEKMGCKNVSPVYHAGEDLIWLEQMKEKYPYILLGGLVTGDRKRVTQDLDRAFDQVLTDSYGEPVVQTHGFGLTQVDMMLRFPWTSVDSTSWAMSAAFGSSLFLLDGKVTQVIFSKESPSLKDTGMYHYSRMPDIMREKIDAMVEKCGVTAEDCYQGYPARRIVNLNCFWDMSKLPQEPYRSTHFELGLF